MDVREALRVNADTINMILSEAGVPDSAYLAVKIANELDPPNNPNWDAERVARLYLALSSTTATLTHEAARTVEMLQAALSIGLDRGTRLAFCEIEPVAEASEERLAKVYDAVVKARDLLHPWLEPGSAQGDALQQAFQLLQDAKYGLGGRTNVAGSIRAARERTVSATDPALASKRP